VEERREARGGFALEEEGALVQRGGDGAGRGAALDGGAAAHDEERAGLGEERLREASRFGVRARREREDRVGVGDRGLRGVGRVVAGEGEEDVRREPEHALGEGSVGVGEVEEARAQGVSGEQRAERRRVAALCVQRGEGPHDERDGGARAAERRLEVREGAARHRVGLDLEEQGEGERLDGRELERARELVEGVRALGHAPRRGGLRVEEAELRRGRWFARVRALRELGEGGEGARDEGRRGARRGRSGARVMHARAPPRGGSEGESRARARVRSRDRDRARRGEGRGGRGGDRG
jgi:hypothetical protein